LRFSNPPRQVPRSLRITNLFNGLALIGWFVFGVGSLFFWTMVMRSDFSYANFRGEKQRTTGRIVGIRETNAKEQKRRVYAHHYEYSVAGQKYEGVSYLTGQTSSRERATIEYLKNDPQRSRIRGMRRRLFSAPVQLLTLIPLTGALIAYFGMKKGRARNRLLESGYLATGTLVDKRQTMVSENRKPVYELTFEFTARDGRRQKAVVRSSAPERLEDERHEPLLYDAENPAQSYLLDELPARPAIDAEGQLVAKPAAARRALMIPALVIALNAILWWFS
jgi:hypothetical protein